MEGGPVSDSEAEEDEEEDDGAAEAAAVRAALQDGALVEMVAAPSAGVVPWLGPQGDSPHLAL